MGYKARAFIPLFPTKHIPVILSCVLSVGDALQKKTSNEHENRLTRRLCAKLNHLPVFRDGPLSIHPQQEILPLDPQKDTPEGYIDISVSCEHGSETYFAIEAKRLRVRSTKGKMTAGNDGYVNEGMMRFITGQYAPFMKSGAMLGYVFDGDTGNARIGVGRYIQRKSDELRLVSPKLLARSKILPKKPVDETRHQLPSREFTLYHLFVAV